MIFNTDTDPLNRTVSEDCDRFIRSYFWGCKEGHALRRKYSHSVERLRAKSERPLPQNLDHWQTQVKEVGTVFPRPHSDRSVMNAFHDCYVHTELCSRCQPVHRLPCQEGYLLLEERDSAREYRLGSNSAYEAAGRPAIHTGRSLEDEDMGVCNAKTAQQKFVEHRNSCPVCVTRPPVGRYTIAAWNAQTVVASQCA